MMKNGTLFKNVFVDLEESNRWELKNGRRNNHYSLKNSFIIQYYQNFIKFKQLNNFNQKKN
ncbi:unnamed protein product [Paramecium primaurelia]|uniref:Uncharacterized protein n=1 Tax=Paramecium primaurelia TaxID=5886 RepID=A0A8S1P022_PARPR|nr:unnamed protein product [Paramecium primaurelia]